METGEFLGAMVAADWLERNATWIVWGLLMVGLVTALALRLFNDEDEDR